MTSMETVSIDEMEIGQIQRAQVVTVTVLLDSSGSLRTKSSLKTVFNGGIKTREQLIATHTDDNGTYQVTIRGYVCTRTSHDEAQIRQYVRQYVQQCLANQHNTVDARVEEISFIELGESHHIEHLTGMELLSSLEEETWF